MPALAPWERVQVVFLEVPHWAHMLANGTGAIIFLNNAYTVTGGATYHRIVSGQGSISMAPFTVTISGSPAITYWALAQNCGVISTATAMVYSGAPAAGTQKYYSLQNAVIVSNGGPAYPGTVAGATAMAAYSCNALPARVRTARSRS